MKMHLKSLQKETEIFFNQSIYTKAFCDLCRPLGSKIALFADESIPFANRLVSFLEENGFTVELFSIPSGESSKTRERKQALEDILLNKGYGRDSLFLSLGGGVISDLIGFLASTYLRGVPLILIPTTVLAMVDASIGGKTGVDTPLGKNLIGSFYLPVAIWMDFSLLETLKQDEWLNGLAEVLKMGLIIDKSIWEAIEATSFDLSNRRSLYPLIEKAALAKVSIVEKDFREASFRAILNFGHTVGHAIEQASHYAWPHGKAVAVGCIAESYLSYRLGFLSRESLDRIVHLFSSLGYPLNPLPSSLLEPMRHDKKNKGGNIRFVLLEEIGKAALQGDESTYSVEEGLIAEMLDWLFSLGK